MKILVIIWAIISILTTCLAVSSVITTRYEFKKKYPKAKVAKVDFGRKFYAYIVGFMMCFFPFYHIIALFTYISRYDTMVEQAIEQIKTRIIEE